jgi:hypothetical protein
MVINILDLSQTQRYSSNRALQSKDPVMGTPTDSYSNDKSFAREIKDTETSAKAHTGTKQGQSNNDINKGRYGQNRVIPDNPTEGGSLDALKGNQPGAV